MNADEVDVLALPAVVAATEALELALIEACEGIKSPMKTLVVIVHTEQMTGFARNGCGCAGCSDAIMEMIEQVAVADEAECTGYFAAEVLH